MWKKGDLFLLIGTSSLLLSATFPKFDLGIFGWVALSPFLFALQRGGVRQAAILGFLFGCLFVIGSFSWALGLAQFSLFSFFIALSVFSLYFAIFGLFYRIISKSLGSWIVIGAPGLWVAVEYLRSNLFFLSFPWNLLGHSQHNYLPVIQIADITGVYGISFLIVMVNQMLSEVPNIPAIKNLFSISKQTHSTKFIFSVLIASIALLFTLSYGWYRLTQTKNGNQIRVALVQPNIITRDFMPLAEQIKQLRAYDRLTREAAQTKPHLIVWPASSLPAPISSNKLVQDTLSKLTQETDSYILVGGAGLEKFGPVKEGSSPFSNSEFLIAPGGKIEGQYHKIRLVPFNEYLPLQGHIKWPEWISTLQQSFIPGEEYTLFQISGIKFGSPICWESMFPDLFRRFVLDGAHFMVSVTNEGFFGHTAAPYQSLAMTVFRAVENKVAIVRVAPTGVSAFIDPDGKIVDRVRDNKRNDLFVAGILLREIPLTHKKTFYTIYGDVFAWIASGFAVLMILASLSLRKRPRSQMRN